MSNIDTLKKYKRILCIVESPNKVKSISKIFKDIGLNNIVVKASVGHISHIKNSGVYNMGIDPKTFSMDLAITDDKKDVKYNLEQCIYKLGIFHFFGLGVDQNDEEAERLYNESLELY